MPASGYLDSPWPGEDGGPERLQEPRHGRGLHLQPGETLGCVTRNTLLSTRFVEFGLAVARVSPDRKSRYGTYWAFVAGGPFEAWR